MLVSQNPVSLLFSVLVGRERPGNSKCTMTRRLSSPQATGLVLPRGPHPQLLSDTHTASLFTQWAHEESRQAGALSHSTECAGPSPGLHASSAMRLLAITVERAREVQRVPPRQGEPPGAPISALTSSRSPCTVKSGGSGGRQSLSRALPSERT